MPSGPYSYELIDPSAILNSGTFSSVNVSQINDLGQVLGTFSGSAGSHPFLYANGGYTDFDVPDAISTIATQLNNAGQVLGRYSDAAGSHSFLYQDGTYTDITVAGAAFTTALQVNDAGQVLGEYFDSTGLHPFIDDNGTFTTLSVPGATSTIVRSSFSAGTLPLINNADQVIGRYVDSTGGHAFLYSYSDGSYTTLNVPGTTNTIPIEINNSGQVLGTYSTGSSVRSFLYSDGTYTTIAVPGATSTNPVQIDDAGQVAGTYQDQAGTHMFLDTDGTYVTINPPYNPASSVSFNQLSNTGDVLGSSFGNTPLSGSQPFIYSDGTSSDVSVPGATPTTAIRINDLGQLIGTFSDGMNSHAFLATPLSTNVMQGAMLNDLLPALPDAVAAVAPEQDNTGAALLSAASNSVELDAPFILPNNQSSFGA